MYGLGLGLHGGRHHRGKFWKGLRVAVEACNCKAVVCRSHCAAVDQEEAKQGVFLRHCSSTVRVVRKQTGDFLLLVHVNVWYLIFGRAHKYLVYRT